MDLLQGQLKVILVEQDMMDFQYLVMVEAAVELVVQVHQDLLVQVVVVQSIQAEAEVELETLLVVEVVVVGL